MLTFVNCIENIFDLILHSGNVFVIEQPRETTAWALAMVLGLCIHLETTEVLRIDFPIIMDLLTFNFLLSTGQQQSAYW